MHVTLEHVREACATGDPQMVALMERLLTQPPPEEAPRREGAYTFEAFLAETRSRTFYKRPLDEQAQVRIEKLAALESPTAEIPLPDRLKSHQILLELWKADTPFSRQMLLNVIRRIPLVYGPFKALKQIFKEAEQRNDTEIYGALAARFDRALADKNHGISRRTLAYLCRRAWRYLRRVGQSLGVCYADTATDYLVNYADGSDYYDSWILNHVFFHETGAYGATKFKFKRYAYGNFVARPESWLKHRAFAELWQRSPRPLFTLLERGQAEVIRAYASQALKTDFRAALRDVEPAWVARLVSVGSASVDTFVVWILDNVPKFEQGKFRELGLHDAVLRLFGSPSQTAQKYAATYARTHARDLPTSGLILLANHRNDEVHKLAVDLLLARDPRKEIGLDAWGELLESSRGFEVAAGVLLKHFGANELSPAWFAERLLSANSQSRTFARDRLPQLHPPKQLGAAYFLDLAERLDPERDDHAELAAYLGQQLEKFDPNTFKPERLRRMLLHRWTEPLIIQWVDQGKLKPQLLEADYLKRIAFHVAWDTDPWLMSLKATTWGKDLKFTEKRAEKILDWLKDVRQFSPDQLGFDWLMKLVERAEPLYNRFATETMTRVFLPADFAPQAPVAAPKASAATGQETTINLGGAQFVFTGKLATMTRDEAQLKVTTAGGANSETVSKTLDYLVIGDEGSPLYGQGRKGSKQTKAEKLNEGGAGIKIISETAFLQMLAGEQREFSADAVQAGCERLWSMLIDAAQPDAPLARFARIYIRRHHPDICLAETDRPVDPSAEIPPAFLSFERVKPLFSHRHKVLRDLALELARWEFARWSPPIEGLVEICESPYPEVRDFVARAMTCDASPDHRRYRVNPDVLTADAVYSFCESPIQETRALGMRLINAHPRLKVPEELFRLTESPDGQVRAFVIRTFWAQYHERGIRRDWKPKAPPEQITKKKKAADKDKVSEVGTGAPPRPEKLPAEFPLLETLLRRILFEVPPGPPAAKNNSGREESLKLRPLPARESKLRLIQTLRDLGIEDIEFARAILPLLREFMQSRGKSEQAACLVAVTRIVHKHPDLNADALA
jgi:hypothetical protein